MVEGSEISTLSHLQHNTSFLLQLVKIIDPQHQVTPRSDEENLKEVCNVVNRYFNDVVDADTIILRGDVEMAKLLCFMINLMLTEGDEAKRRQAVGDVQQLPNDVQTYLMKMIKVVCDHRTEDCLISELTKLLQTGDVDESDSRSATNSPEPQDGSYLYGGTPKEKETRDKRKETIRRDAGIISNDSPIGRYLGSSQYLYKKVMVENTQLKKEINNKYNEQIEVAEHKIIDLREEKKKIAKENEFQLQKNKDMEATINNLNKEIEYLTDDLSVKDKTVSRHEEEIARLKRELNGMESSLRERQSISNELREKIKIIDDERTKNKQLMESYRQIESQHKAVKEEYRNIKQTSDSVLFQMEKMKLDHIDIVGHLKEEIARLERQNVPSEVATESLGESIRREVEIKNLQTDVERLQGELRASEDSSREKNESHGKQVNQYMDQITALLKQVQEHGQRNTDLSLKMTETETQCKLLEKEVCAREETSKRLSGNC